MITLWDATKDQLSLRDAMNRLIEQSFVPAPPNQGGFALDVIETAEDFVVRASLPGCERDKINVSFQDDTLTISAQLNQSAVPEKSRYLLHERFAGEARRSLTLPVRVDADKAAADYKDGVLTLTLPKSEAVKPRTIKIA